MKDIASTRLAKRKDNRILIYKGRINMYRNKRTTKRSYKLNNKYSASYIAQWIKGKSSKSTIVQFCEGANSYIGANTSIGGGL